MKLNAKHSLHKCYKQYYYELNIFTLLVEQSNIMWRHKNMDALKMYKYAYTVLNYLIEY